MAGRIETGAQDSRPRRAPSFTRAHDADAGRCRTPPTGSTASSGSRVMNRSRSTMAGAGPMKRRCRSARRSPAMPRARSSPRTSLPIYRSTSRSTPIAVANMAASTATARPSHAYLGFSPGLDFESRLLAKPDAPRLLARALARPSYRCQLLALGTNTDPYQPVERTWRITRGILEVLADHRHPVGVVTKSSMVTRDIDLLSAMAEEGPRPGVHLSHHPRPQARA